MAQPRKTHTSIRILQGQAKTRRTTVERKRRELVKRLSELLERNHYPGGRLPPERDLAVELGVSRNLLREAIVAMEAMGLVEVRERQGTFAVGPGDFAGSLRFLPDWTAEVLGHLMEARLCIEPRAAYYAASRRTERELERMEECLMMLEKLNMAEDRGIASGARWDSTLHALIVEASRNPVVVRLHEGFAAAMEKRIADARRLLLQRGAWPGTILDEHRRIVAAIRAGDGAAARDALEEHLENALDQLAAIGAEGTGRT